MKKLIFLPLILIFTGFQLQVSGPNGQTAVVNAEPVPGSSQNLHIRLSEQDIAKISALSGGGGGNNPPIITPNPGNGENNPPTEHCTTQGNVVCGGNFDLMKADRVFNLPYTSAIIPAGSYSSRDTAEQFKTVFRREFTTTGSTTAAGTIAAQFENGLAQRYSIKTANPSVALDVSTNKRCSSASVQSVTISWTTRSNVRSYCVLQPNTTYFLDIEIVNHQDKFTLDLGNNITSDTPYVKHIYVEERQIQSQ